jgi:DNA replication and repair protein RecF
LVKEEEDLARIELLVEREDRERELLAIIPKLGVKQYRVGGVPKRRAGLVGELGVVLFLPEELELPYRSPSRRRRYIDRFLEASDPVYGVALRRMERVLEQRNRLLKKAAEGQVRGPELSIWTEQLVEPATKVAETRFRLIDELAEWLTKEYGNISGEERELQARYSSALEREGYAESLRRALERSLDQDIRYGSTSQGPHRDDLVFSLDGYDLADRASRGEVRTAMLSLKLSELAIIEGKTGFRPLLLLDDVFSELDELRRHALVKRLKGYQSIITTTDAEHVDPALQDEAEFMHVTSGKVTRHVAKDRRPA